MADDPINQLLTRVNLPLFDIGLARNFLVKVYAEFAAFNGILKQNHLDHLIEKINRAIPSNLSCNEKIRELASDLIAIALLPPLLENGQVMSVLSFNKTLSLLQLLNDDSLIQRIDPRYFTLKVDDPHYAARSSLINPYRYNVSAVWNAVTKKIWDFVLRALLVIRIYGGA